MCISGRFKAWNSVSFVNLSWSGYCNWSFINLQRGDFGMISLYLLIYIYIYPFKNIIYVGILSWRRNHNVEPRHKKTH
jgi:hypothetical protein